MRFAKRLQKRITVNWESIVRPSARIAFNAEIGKGTIVMPNAVVNVCATVGNHCVINTGAIVEHDNVIENYAHISPNVALRDICASAHIPMWVWMQQ